jgi:hypothetical protein
VARSSAPSAKFGIAQVKAFASAFSALSLLSTLFALSAHAQGWIEIERPVSPKTPVGDIQRTTSQVRLAVDGRVAKVEVEERFRNTGNRLASSPSPPQSIAFAKTSSLLTGTTLPPLASSWTGLAPTAEPTSRRR